MRFPSVRTCISLSAFLALVSCGPETLQQPKGGETLLTVGVPHADSVIKDGRRTYSAAVLAESAYVVRMRGLSGNADLKVFGTDETLTENWYCMVDLTGALGTEDEYCIILATGTMIYLSVEGRRLETSSADYTIEVQALPLIALPISAPVAGEAPRGGAVVYVTNVLPGLEYVTGPTVLSDRATRVGTWGNSGGYSLVNHFGGPFDLIVRATGAKLYVAIDASVIATPSVQFVVVTTPAAVILPPVTGTSGAVPAGIPTIGFVAPEGESFYHAEGMISGEHLISLLGLTAMAYFRVFDDSLRTIEKDCTALTPRERECKVTGTSVYFSVRAAPFNEPGGETGAGYVMLVR